MLIKVYNENGECVGMIVINKHDFKTGSKGYFGNAKLEINGKRYQAMVQLVEIGSKAKTNEGEK